MGNEKILTESEIVAKYRRNKNKKDQIQIMSELNNCTKHEIEEILQRNGAFEDMEAKKERRSVRMDENKALELYEKGLKFPEIAKEMGESNKYIYNWALRRGLTGKAATEKLSEKKESVLKAANEATSVRSQKRAASNQEAYIDIVERLQQILITAKDNDDEGIDKCYLVLIKRIIDSHLQLNPKGKAGGI